MTETTVSTEKEKKMVCGTEDHGLRV